MYLKTSKMCVLYAVTLRGFWEIKEKIPETKLIGRTSLCGPAAYKVVDCESDILKDNGHDWFQLAQQIVKNGTYSEYAIICIPEKYIKVDSKRYDDDDCLTSLTELTLQNGETISLHSYHMTTMECTIPSTLLKR